jgi:heptosyltransferase I
LDSRDKTVSSDRSAPAGTIFVVRLGAMGDILHTLPAVASLKQSFPHSKLVWLVASRWVPLLEGNPSIDELIPFNRSRPSDLQRIRKQLRTLRPEMAFDFQGLLQSAMLGRASRPRKFYGFSRSVAREPWAALFYTHRVAVAGPHRIERNLQLGAAAGATRLTSDAWLPAGSPEGDLPGSPYILTCPFAGWPGKEWPLSAFDLLAERLQKSGFELVANVSTDRVDELKELRHVRVHTSSLAGLIYATRRATGILGLDSGPLHLAAALKKPGVALFGPTDPKLTGPFGGSIKVLRAPDVESTYKRHSAIHSSMKQIQVEQVAEGLLQSVTENRSTGGSSGATVEEMTISGR